MREQLSKRIKELAREIVAINNRSVILAPKKRLEEAKLMRAYRHEREELKAQLRALGGYSYE